MSNQVYTSNRHRSRWPALLVLSFWLLFLAFDAQATNQAREPISVNFENLTVKEVFKALNVKAGLRFVYASGDIDEQQRLTFHAPSASAKEIVRAIFARIGVAYKIKDETIIIQANPKGSASRQRLIRGRIINAQDQPISNATVQ